MNPPENNDIARPSQVFPRLTTPTEVKRHARPHRGVDVLPSSSFHPGRFGRLFRNLPVFELEDRKEKLESLAARMTARGGAEVVENLDIPSGYTYVGQFIDHDITFDPASSLQRQNDPDALHNFRTPRFDLDSVYGRGPADQPYLYNGPRLRLGEDVRVSASEAASGPDLPRNIPRNLDGQPNFGGVALIGDPRNDENLIVSQLHGVFLKFHNAVVDHVESTTPLRNDNLFKEAQRLVRWHYQWVVINDFLRRIVGMEVLDDILREEKYVVTRNGAPREISVRRPRLMFYHPDQGAYMPVEFSVAAYRFGHSMIRDDYHINTFLREVGAGPFPIFGQEELPANDLTNLNGFRRLPDDWGIEWQFFFTGLGADDLVQPSLAIDTQLAGPLNTLPASVAEEAPPSLAARNLLRGARLGLPSGTSVARAMGIEPLTAEELELGDIDDEQLAMHPPLWYYVLQEADALQGGTKLGPVGGRIVAEVLVGLLAHDPLSYLSVEPGWRPQAPFADENGHFEMAQLISFASGNHAGA